MNNEALHKYVLIFILLVHLFIHSFIYSFVYLLICLFQQHYTYDLCLFYQ